MQRRKKYFYIILVALSVGLFASCSVYDEFDSPLGSVIPKGPITIEEVKAGFEKKMIQAVSKSNGKDLKGKGLATYFTPQWEDAVMSVRDSIMIAVDVPILTDYIFKFKVNVPEGDSSETKPFCQVKQKLVVVKNLPAEKLSFYVVSILPDKDYANSERWKSSAIDFSNYGDRGNFSGWVIYSLPMSTTALRVDYFQNGKLTDEASAFGLRNKPEEAERVRLKAREMLKGITLIAKNREGLQREKEK